MQPEASSDIWVDDRRVQRGGWHRLLVVPGGNSTLHPCVLLGRRYLLKWYPEERLDELDVAALAGLVRWRGELSTADRSRLDRSFSWPHYIVTRSRRTRGVLVPVAADEFLFESNGYYRPRMLSNLSRPGQPARSAQRAMVRATALAAREMLWLHGLDAIVHDVQPDNILWSRRCGIYYVDCDTMVGPWGSAFPPVAPADFEDAIPDVYQPSRSIDFARLAWTAIGLLLGSDLVEAPGTDDVRRLVDLLDWESAELLVEAAGAKGTGEHLVGRWHEFIRRFACSTPDPLLPTSYPVWTRRVGTGWMPDDLRDKAERLERWDDSDSDPHSG